MSSGHTISSNDCGSRHFRRSCKSEVDMSTFLRRSKVPDSAGLSRTQSDSRTQLENTEVDIKQVGNFLGEAWLADFDGCVWVTDLMRCTQCALCITSIHRPTYQAVSLSLSPCMKSQHLSQMEWPPGPQDLCFIKGLLSNGILRVLDSVQGISLQGLPQTTLPILNMKTWESSCGKP